MPDRLLSRIGFSLLKRGVRIPFSARVRQYEEYASIRDLIRREHVDLVLDVGAFKGWFAEHLRWMGYTGKIISFEPSSAAFADLKSAAEGDPAWQVEKLALGSTNGTMNLNVVKQTSVLNSLRQPLRADAVSKTETVEVKTLESYLNECAESYLERKIFLKLDTQGFDVEVLRGAEPIISRIAVLQSEISVIPLYEGMTHYTEALAYYERLGFQLEDMFVVSRRGSRPVEYDCLMTRAEQSW